MRGLLLVGLCAGMTGLAQAQSLGDVARREKEKERQKAGSPAPTYTADDLKSPRTKSKGTVSELPVAGPSTVASPSPSPEPDRAVQERVWRARFAEARLRIAEAEARAWEDRIEVVFVGGLPVQQKVRVKVETGELRQARKGLEDLEEELRRAGGLPGWGRE